MRHQPVKPLSPKVPVTGRVNVATELELRRLARRAGMRDHTYIAVVLEAHAKKHVICPTCGHEHPIHRERGE